MPEQSLPPEGQEPIRPVSQAEIDPTSVPGVPEYIPPDEFRQNLDKPKAVTPPGTRQGGGHEADPFLANAMHLERVAVYGGIAVANCLVARGIINYIVHREPEKYAKVFELASNPGTVMYQTCAGVMAAAAVTATLYRLEAKKIEQQYRDW